MAWVCHSVKHAWKGRDLGALKLMLLEPRKGLHLCLPVTCEPRLKPGSRGQQAFLAFIPVELGNKGCSLSSEPTKTSSRLLPTCVLSLPF